MCRKKIFCQQKVIILPFLTVGTKSKHLLCHYQAIIQHFFASPSINGQTYYQSKREKTLFLRHSPTHKRHRSVIIAIATDIEVDIKRLLITCFCIRHILVNHIQTVEPHAMLLASNKLCKSTQPLELSTCLPRRVLLFLAYRFT